MSNRCPISTGHSHQGGSSVTTLPPSALKLRYQSQAQALDERQHGRTRDLIGVDKRVAHKAAAVLSVPAAKGPAKKFLWHMCTACVRGAVAYVPHARTPCLVLFWHCVMSLK